MSQRTRAGKGSNAASQHQFSQIPSTNIPRSKFDRSHSHRTTFDAGDLIPILVDEVLPGDTLSLNLDTFCRLTSTAVPVMDNMYLDVFFFFVPNRLIWDNWQKFMGEQENPGDSTDFLVPTLTSDGTDGFVSRSLEDHFGLPTEIPDLEVNALHHRAYNRIYADWFRDENLVDSPPLNKGNGPDLASDYTLLRRGKRHDYFTSALPFPQKGDAVTLPLGTTAPVVGSGSAIPTFAAGANTAAALNYQASSGSVRQDGTTGGNDGDLAWVAPNLEADLTTATAATINSIREAVTLQQLLERDARGGTRYTELNRAHFGVISPDARLQRAEYLGGGSARFMVHPVAQTGTPTNQQNTPPSTLSAFSTAGWSGRGFNKSFTEHGVLIGLACARADLTYQAGLDRMWSRQTKYDYAWPDLSHLGEQVIKNKEIYAQGSGDPTADEEAFGYQERYAEYRYKNSLITGRFRSNSRLIPGAGSRGDASLDQWHLSQDFTSLPVLNDEFIEEDPPINRTLSVSNEPQFLLDMWFQYIAARPLPVYSVPGLNRF